MDCILREAVNKDAEAITLLSRQLGYDMTLQATVQNLETIQKNKSEIVLVAICKKQVAAWIHIFCATRLISESFCEIGGLVVDEKFRRMGIGKMLVEKSIEWSRDKGVPIIRVRSNIKRAEAHEFYLQSGFKETKQQKIFEMKIKK